MQPDRNPLLCWSLFLSQGKSYLKGQFLSWQLLVSFISQTSHLEWWQKEAQLCRMRKARALKRLVINLGRMVGVWTGYNIEKIISWNVFKRVGYIEKRKAELRDTRNSRPRLALALPEKLDDCKWPSATVTHSCCKTAERWDHKRNGLWRAAPLCLYHLPWSSSVSQSHHLFIVLRTCAVAEISLAPRVLAISCFIGEGWKERVLYKQRRYVKLAALSKFCGFLPY